MSRESGRDVEESFELRVLALLDQNPERGLFELVDVPLDQTEFRNSDASDRRIVPAGVSKVLCTRDLPQDKSIRPFGKVSRIEAGTP